MAYDYSRIENRIVGRVIENSSWQKVESREVTFEEFMRPQLTEMHPSELYDYLGRDLKSFSSLLEELNKSSNNGDMLENIRKIRETQGLYLNLIFRQVATRESMKLIKDNYLQS